MSDGISLNDTLLTGAAKLQKDLVALLLKFRIYETVFSCDIKNMFNEIMVSKDHQNYQCFLWRFAPEEPVRVYKFKRVLFGIKSSPYLTNKCIRQLIVDEGFRFRKAASILSEDIYVDDVITGFSQTISEGLVIRNKLISLLGFAGFELRKWTSNNPELLVDMPESHLQSNDMNFDVDKFIKILEQGRK